MNRREFLTNTALGAAAVSVSYGLPSQLGAQTPGSQPSAEETVFLSAKSGSDSNPGTQAAPLQALAAAAKRVSARTKSGPTTIILDEGLYAVSETADFRTTLPYAQSARLTIRAAVLPDDPDWNPGRMPTLIHTMPLSVDWNGRKDPFGGVAYGMHIWTSHVTIQGLRILGMPVVEHPTAGAIHRLYAIGREDTSLDDLEIKQCLFVGDEVTCPNHAPMLLQGKGIVLDHCVWYNVKQGVIFLTPGSTGHAMRNCLIYGSYACSVWTSAIANDFDYHNNVVSNSDYVWIGQGARSIRNELATGRAEAPPSGPPPGMSSPGPPPGMPPPGSEPKEKVHYRVRDSLFAGNKKLSGSGAGPALNFRDTDPSFLELINTKVIEQNIELELDQSKRNYLQAVAGSEAAKIGAGLFFT